MKNKKLLMPLAGVAALGAVTPVVMMATSCGEKPDASISKIEAYADRTSLYLGETIKKSDIHVTATTTAGVVKDLDPAEWTCSEIGDSGYVIKEMGEKTFDIAYKGHHTSLTIECQAYGYLVFEQLPYNLVVGNVTTAEDIHVYGASKTEGQEEMHEIDLSLLDLSVEVGDEYVKIVDGKLIGIKSGPATIRAHYKEAEGKTYDALLDFRVFESGKIISSAEIGTLSGNATVTIKGAMKTKTTGFFKVPDYVVEDDTLYPVTSIAADADMEAIYTLYINNTVTSIPADMFATKNTLQNVIYDGTTRQWSRVRAGDNWAGAGCVGGWCIDQDEPEFVYFTNCQASKYDETSKSLVSEKAVGRGDLLNGHYTVEFDIALAYLYIGESALKFNRIQLVNTAVAPMFTGSLEIMSIYLDGKDVTESFILDEDTHTLKNALYTAESFTLTATSRLIVKFKTPGLSLNSVTAKFFSK